ncbi:molybdopterin-dependent oxidoreductase [Halobiforma nitratireducens]|uniref:Molybdopterin oxidoreductase n=1 Tax=Halobiforma nitratireducens JCM 10879 TaxID=1227454 RepID=M0MMK7_9EURY|nr:molybdopterin-dependent oxidoreductase [Halobiforma nitratireducens]EMA46906.1 molybdopterin oxidoreductase [Halobiforma nitratireducens JCM 10879]
MSGDAKPNDDSAAGSDGGLDLTRRELGAAAAGIAGASGLGLLGYRRLGQETAGDAEDGPMNPFEEYPNDDWDEKYREVWDRDDSFILTCTPNDTHNCYLEGSVKNGEITRLGPSMNYGEAEGLNGEEATKRWDPRVCNKGLAMIERFYSDQRVKAPMVREGFKQWVEDGFPREDDGSMPQEYANRGEDSWEEVDFDEAYELAARTILEIAEHYNGDDGVQDLLEQDYDERVVEETDGIGTQTLKFRGGMPLLGMIRLMGMYRVANQMALVDEHVRDVDPDEAVGGVGLDNYSWHTDLPPGHTMVTGQQTIDFDLVNVEYADHVVLSGINWLTTKMADSHWLTEARLKGTKITGVFTDYNATASKCDELVVLRPGTDSALFLGAAKIIMEEEQYDEDYVRRNTDLPMLVRMDEKKLLRASDVIEGYEPENLEKTQVVGDDDERPPEGTPDIWDQILTEDLRTDWGDFVVHDGDTDEFEPVTRDEIGDDFDIPATLEGSFEIETVDGETVEVRPVFDLVKQHLIDTWDAESVAEVTGSSPEAVENLAADFADNQEETLILTGMGPNHYTNQDQKDRAAFLLASLTKNIGQHAGNIGSYAGNYRGAYFNGRDQWIYEDPFDPELDPDSDADIRNTQTAQSAHWYSHGDRPLKIEGEYHMGDSHMPTPTKLLWVSGSNSILGNAKGSYDIIENMLRNGRIEAFFTSEWWWTGTCEYSDIVFPVDSWAEHHQNDITAAVTNPFVMAMPATEMDRIYDTRNDAEIYAGVAEKLGELLDDDRFEDYWAFIDEEHEARPYLQRIIDYSNTVKGYDIDEMLEEAEDGIPKIIQSRTYPKKVGSEQALDDRPWYTKTGRLEFFREEDMFAEAGENIPLHREPMDGTFYEPNAIVSGDDHPMIDPETPESLGVDDRRDGDARQVRNPIYTPDELTDTEHPLKELDEGYDYSYMTPKYRHGTHTFANSLPNIAVWWGPFGDMERHDERSPYYGEGYIEMNPEDMEEEGFKDGDYVWVDADPEDRPYRGADSEDEDNYARAKMRVRSQPAMPKGVTRSWMNLNGASHKTYEAHEDDESDGMAVNEETDYPSLYRQGSHQSATRTWFRPTLLTDDMARKDYGGQNVGTGFMPDVHSANGAPKEAFVKVEKAEDAAHEDDEDRWMPDRKGLRPSNEDDRMNEYLSGGFVSESDD